MLLRYWRNLLFLFLTSCSSGVISHQDVQPSQIETKSIKYEFWVDETFTFKERQEIFKSIHHWNYIFNRQIIISVEGFVPVPTELINNKDAPINGYWFIKTDNQNQYIKQIDEEYSQTHPNKRIITLAFANQIGGDKIFLNMDRVDLDKLTKICDHEIAHILGAVHQEGGLMSPILDKKGCIDKATIMQIVYRLDLNPQIINWSCAG